MFRVCLVLLVVLTSPCLAAETRSPQDASERGIVSGFIEDSAVLLRSSSTSSTRIARRETAGPDTFAIYGGPDRPGEGRFEDAGGSMSWNGWTPVDLTDLPVYFHVDTFNAENLNANGLGNHAMWSGQTAADQPGWAAAPGYGDYWLDGLLYESGPVTNPTVGQTVSLDFFFNHDTEPDYDFFFVEYDSAGIWTRVCSADGTNADVSGVFQSPGVRFSDVSSGAIDFVGNDYGGPAGDRIRIRFRVESDRGLSDEDGGFDSAAGAVQVDDITLTTSEGSFSEDFEGPGPYLFRPDKTPFVGDFADLYPGFIDIDPCRSNYTPVVGFIDYGQQVRNGPGLGGEASTGGSTSPGVSYGIPGYWVTNASGGLTFGEGHLRNAIESPEIPWDLATTADDGVDIAGAFARLSVWRHLPLANQILFQVHVRSAAMGEGFGRWRHDTYWYFGNGSYWVTSEWFLSDLLVDSPERIQIRLVAEDINSWAGWLGPKSGNSTPAPIFDNVSVYKYRVPGIEISGSTLHIPSDSFPPSGAIDVSTPSARDALDIPVDMAMDRNTGLRFIVPGDSIVATAKALIPGTTMQDFRMFWALRTNPLFEDAIRTAPTGVLHENVVTGPAGTIWTGQVIADTCRNSFDGAVVEDQYFFTLPDVDFMYPGDELQYYFQATDSDGRISTLPSDISRFGQFDGTYIDWGRASGLPSISDGSGTQPPILILNYMGDAEAAMHPVERSLMDLGMSESIDYDVYTARCIVCWPNSSGVGSAGGHGALAQQVANYSTILYFGDILTDGTELGGRFSKSDDISLLEDWHRLPGRRNVAYFGDNLAQILAGTPAKLGYLNNTMGVQYQGDDVVPFLGDDLSPEVRPDHAAFSASYFTYYYCQLDAEDANYIGIIKHSHIVPAAGAEAGHGYINSSTELPVDGVAASVIIQNPNAGVTGYDVTFPYAFQWIYSPVGRAAGFAARTHLLREILDLFAEDTTQPAVDAPALGRGTLELQVAPNPFNPRTVVSFDVRAGERGSVRVYNLRGELVRSLHEGEFQAQEFTWNGLDDRGASVSSGVYVVRASAGGEQVSRKVALVR